MKRIWRSWLGRKEYVIRFKGDSLETLLAKMNYPDPDPNDPIEKNSSFLQIARFKKIKVEIFANEHPPPHFRIKTNDGTANFRIDNCEPINGDPNVLRCSREIKKWHRENKNALIKAWNETRPSDCPVGEYRE